jgi:hypothetical protein
MGVEDSLVENSTPRESEQGRSMIEGNTTVGKRGEGHRERIGTNNREIVDLNKEF